MSFGCIDRAGLCSVRVGDSAWRLWPSGASCRLPLFFVLFSFFSAFTLLALKVDVVSLFSLGR